MTVPAKQLQVRRTAPAPLVEYFLDSALEMGEIDTCSALALRLYGDDAAILPIVSVPGMATWRQRCGHCLDLVSIADELLLRIPEQRRAGLVRQGLVGVVDEAVMTAETFSNWAIDDEIEGGDMEPFRDRVRSRNGVPFKRTARRLRAPKFIRRHVKRYAEDNVGHLRKLAAIALRRARETAPAVDATIMADIRAQLNFRKVIEERQERRAVRAARRAILRAWRVAVSVLGTEAVSAFLRGDELKLIGAETILVVRKRGLLSDRGHGCLSIGLASRDGARLADLCTYVTDTPTLDQLSAFALWMQSGEDRSVLARANITDLSEAGRDHPLISERRNERANEHLATMIEAVGEDQARRIMEVLSSPRRPFRGRQLTYEQIRARNDAYWEETKGHWIAAMMVQVFGHKNFPILKAAGAM